MIPAKILPANVSLSVTFHIRSGDSVIIMNEVVLKQYICCDLENKKGGTADSKVIDNQTLSVPCM